MGFGSAGLALSTSIFSASEMDVFSTPTVIDFNSRSFWSSPRRFLIWACRAIVCLNRSGFLVEPVLDSERGGEVSDRMQDLLQSEVESLILTVNEGSGRWRHVDD